MPLLRKPKMLYWTAHSKGKMRFYGLSEQRVKRVIHSPKRLEDGVAPKTIAMMQIAGSKKRPTEIWVMVQDVGSKRKVISAWRYPGITKSRSEIALSFLRNELSEFEEAKK